MNKRVYGVLGISAIMANWNADFSGYPKTTTKNQIFASDKAFKYPMKRRWEDEGKKVLYIKSLDLHEKTDNDISLVPRTLKERYEYIFPEQKLKDVNNYREILKNLFLAIDVKNFGATFAEKNANIAITGAVQIGQGFNKYDNSDSFEQPILSPFKNPNPKTGKDSSEMKNSSLGTKIICDEAHYFYPFSINANAYNEFVKLGVTEGYTEDDYKEFKQVALTAATSFATNAKAGCENEFGLFVETESDLYLPNLDKYITFEKGEKNIIEITCGNLLNEVADRINKIEIYYNPDTTKIVSDIKNAVYFNIVSGKKVDR